MIKSAVLLVFSIVFLTLGCTSNTKKQQDNRLIYQAIKGKDTATLSLIVTGKHFHGQYEIQHYKVGKDSGDVRGKFVGDTLRGDYHYITYGGSWKRIPIALLKKQNKLYLGNGIVTTYLNLPCFMPGEPIEYDDPEFIFELLPQPKK